MKKFFTAILSVILIAAVVFCAYALLNDDIKFNIGGIDENGKYVETASAIYSDALPCRGLSIKVAFESKANFRVFYYDASDVFLGSTEILSDDYNDDNPYATYCRILLIPRTDFVQIDKNHIRDYTKTFEITTDDAQYCNYTKNLFVSEEYIDVADINSIAIGIPPKSDSFEIEFIKDGSAYYSNSFTNNDNGYLWESLDVSLADKIICRGDNTSKIFSADTVGIYKFTAGTIDERGDFIQKKIANTAVSEMFECQGLSVKPLIDSATYQIFWYNIDGLYFEKTEASSAEFTSDKVPPFAKYARILVNKGYIEKSSEIGKVNLTVKVDKEQISSYVTSNLYDDSKATYGRSFYVSEDMNSWLVNASANELLITSNMKTSEIMSLTNECKTVEINVKPIYHATANCFIAVLDANKEVIQQGYIHLAGNIPEQWYQTRITLLDEAAFIRVTMFSNSDCQIYGLK